MDLQLADKIALVSGSTAGIGNAIAAALSREGATVIVNGRTSAAVEAAVAAMQSATQGKVLGFAGDLSLSSVAENLVQLPHRSPLHAAWRKRPRVPALPSTACCRADALARSGRFRG